MPHNAVARSCRKTESARRWTLLGAAGLALVACAAPAAAQEPTGGTAPVSAAPKAPATATPLAPAVTANLYGRTAPRIKRVTCRSACGGPKLARPGSLVRVYGRNLAKVDEVIFLGAAGEGDDASVAPSKIGKRSLLARVPRTALTGRVALALLDGTRSPATHRPLGVQPIPPLLPAGTIDAEVQGHKVFFGAQRPAELSYVVGGSEAADVVVELVRAADGVAIAQWTPGRVQPGLPQTVRWDGTADGEVQQDGVYRFRVTATDPSGVRAMSSQGTPQQGPDAFTFLGYRFPVAGAHGFGEFAATFGGGRGHQGQDVFAACGTPIVAARGGVVKFKQYHSRAGYYVVIDGARTGVDFAYMHLREAALVNQGDRVKTGQLIGFVGDTGDADGCHLHFEEWTAPGWYSGGSAFDPLPDLQAWDAES
jgi:murein DD-endopeptidase MepM/ murein hydrolase activator NlpD